MATAEKRPPGAEDFEFPDEKTDDKSAVPEGELEVEIVDDTPEKDKGRKALEKKVEEPTEEELESYSDKVKARISELTHARHDERRRAEAAARERDEALAVSKRLMEERKQLSERFNTGQEAFISMAKEKAEAELKAAKAALKKAHEDFDTDAIVEAQAAVASATLRMENAKNFKPAPVQLQEVEVERGQRQAPPKVDEKTLSWQARNQWFGAEDTQAETSYALGVHADLVRKGYDPRSDAYFAQIDARMKSKFPELYEAEEADDKPSGKEPPKKPATVVAPASRTVANGKVRLTKTQVALAERLGITPQQYAAQLLKLQENQ